MVSEHFVIWRCLGSISDVGISWSPIPPVSSQSLAYTVPPTQCTQHTAYITLLTLHSHHTLHIETARYPTLLNMLLPCFWTTHKRENLHFPLCYGWSVGCIAVGEGWSVGWRLKTYLLLTAAHSLPADLQNAISDLHRRNLFPQKKPRFENLSVKIVFSPLLVKSNSQSLQCIALSPFPSSSTSKSSSLAFIYILLNPGMRSTR